MTGTTETQTDPQEFVRDKPMWVSYAMIGNACYILASFGPFMPYLREELGLDYTVSSLHFSAWALGGITAGAIGYFLIRKVGPNIVWVCSAGLSLSLGVLLSAKIAAVTILSAMVAGCFSSVMGHGLVTILSERFGPKRTIGIIEANLCGSLFAMMAPLVVGQCVRLGLGWRTALLLPIGLFAILFISAGKNFSNYSVGSRTATGGSLPKRYWYFWIVIFMSVACEWSIIFWTPEFLQKSKGFAKEDAVQLASIFLVFMLVGRFLGLKVMRSVETSRLLVLTSALALLGYLIYWLGMPSYVSLIGLGLVGLGTANIYPLSFSQAIGSASEKPGLAAARMSISTGIAVLSAPLILGAIADRSGIHEAYAVVATLQTAATIMLFIATLRKR